MRSTLLTTASVLLGILAASGLRADDAGARNYLVSEAEYTIPDVELVDQSGRAVDLAALADGDKRTIISFIFTSCAGICPMITANVARSVPALSQIDEDYRIVLITVDPEHDTPRRLAEYAARFGTGERIRFLTGSSDSVFSVLRALDAVYEGDNKMNHQPVTLISLQRGGRWHRVDGLIGSDTLIEQYRTVVDNSGAMG